MVVGVPVRLIKKELAVIQSRGKFNLQVSTLAAKPELLLLYFD